MLLNGIFIPSCSYLPQTNENQADVPAAKRRRLHKDWSFDSTFKSKVEAVAAVESENCWAYYYQNKSAAGVRINYRCKSMKFRGPQCAAALYLLFDATNTSVHLYRSDSPHTHENNSNAVNTISGELEREIRLLFERNTKPKAILYHLTRNGFEAPTKTKLNNFLTKLRNEKFGSERLHFDTLEMWLKDCMDVPLNESQPFVVAYEVNVDDENPTNSKFRFLISTVLLLRQAADVKKKCILTPHTS